MEIPEGPSDTCKGPISRGSGIFLSRPCAPSNLSEASCEPHDANALPLIYSHSSLCPASAVGRIPAALCEGCRGQLLGQTGRRRSSEVCPLTVDGPFQGPLMGCATHPWIVNGDHWDAWVACSSQRTFFFWSVMIVLSQAGTITRPYSARIQYRSCAAGS